MLRLNRTTEYGLIALAYIRSKPNGELTSAREIADHFKLPFEILAKTLQRLKDQGVISSTYGTRGGYVLSRDLTKLDLAEFLAMMEGPVSVVACQHPGMDEHDCDYHAGCNIRFTMSILNARFQEFLHRVSVEEITRTPTNIVALAANAARSRSDASLQGDEP